MNSILDQAGWDAYAADLDPVARDMLAKDRQAIMAHNAAMAAAILRALQDNETGTGWGPDVTVASYLRAALPESLRP